METSDRLSMQMLETEPHVAIIPRTLSPIPMSRSSVDRTTDYGSHSSDSGVGQDYTRRTASMEQIHSSTGIQLPVKHVTQSGTQRGTLIQRYHIHSHSKCIMCKDCGIFFTYDIFLGHTHDKHGRKRLRPQADFLELDMENPGLQQIRAWEDFLVKMGQKAGTTDSKLRSANFDSVNRLREQVPDSLNVQRTSNGQPEHIHNGENISSRSASLSDFDRNVQESVNASERLLRETSQYLHSSAEKLRHRRQKSLRNHQLHPKALLPNDLVVDDAIFSGSSAAHVQPVIKDPTSTGPNSQRPNRKFLEKYLEKSRDSFQLLTDSLVSKSTAKSESLKVENSIHAEYLQQQESQSLGGEDIRGGMVRDAVLGGGGDAEKEAGGHASLRPISPGKTPRGKSILLQEHFDRNDPLFIVQTAQELLTLAALKMQDRPQNSPGIIDWQKRYEVERELNKHKDNRIKKLEGLLQEEQRKRKEVEVHLRAIRLQNL